MKSYPLPLRLFVLLGLVSPVALAVGTRQFVLQSGKDFEGGELKGVAVDSLGRVRPGFELSSQAVSEAPAVWDAVEHEGGLLLATGNEGKLIRVSGGRSSVAFDSDALALTSIVKAFGRVFVGTTPSGKLLEWKGNQLVPFAALEGAETIYAMAVAKGEAAIYVATGPEGKLFRVTSDGRSTVHFKSEQKHLVSVAESEGRVYVGTSGAALLYKVNAAGRAEVLFDFGTTEVRSILPSKGGLWVLANELKGEGSGRATDAKKGKGVLARIKDDGTHEILFESEEEHLVSLSLDETGAPVAGGGSSGKVYRINAEHGYSVLADIESRQVVQIKMSQGNGYLLGSDPISLETIRGVGGATASYSSKVLDAGIKAKFGVPAWDSEGRVEVQTRTGNTKEPDASWSDFSAVRPGAEISSPSGRFLQVRVLFPEASEKASFSRLVLPFLTDNLRAVLTRIDLPESLRKHSSGLERSGVPSEDKRDPKLKIQFSVDNPDKDELRYRVEYKPLGSPLWFDALRPGEVLKDEKFTWDTTHLPEGKYRLRVTVSDELSNPPGRATSHTLESSVLMVDSSSPKFEGVLVEGRRVRGTVTDALGPVLRLEVQDLASEQWFPLSPVDGVFDEAREEFNVDLGALVGQGPAHLTLRAYDAASNFELHRIEFK